MGFSPYLHFQGNCAEAMAFYAKVFGATDLSMMRYSEAPPDAGMPAGSTRIMHAQMTAGGSPLMASDFPDGMAGDPQQAVTISYDVPTVAEGRALFDRLVAGGAPIMPFAQTFWSPGFGMLKDRFGTHWMISAHAA